MADGTITFSTALDNGQLEKDLKKAEADVERLKRKLDSSTAKRGALEEEMDGAQRAIEATSRKAEELRARLEELRAVDPTNQEAYESARREIASMQYSLERAEQREAQLANDKYKLDQKWAKVNGEVRQHEAELDTARQRAAQLGDEYQRAYTGAGPAIQRSMQQASDGFAKLGDRINTMVRRVFVLQVALSALRNLRTMLSSALMENERLSASVAGLKAAFQGVVNYVANALAPAIIGAVNAAASAIMWLARLVDSVFGTRIAESIARAQQAAQASWRQGNNAGRAADNLGNQGKATKKLAKETEKATKTVLGFDEINALNADDAADAADGIGGEAGAMAGDGLKPDWDALDVGKIDAKLAEIMLILGAALMAVGAILAFSGINIPVGLTLMVIGAAMIYAAYQEQWDLLPEKVRNAITGLLVVTGIALLALGAILALSGASVPLGIGMMVAGALLIWTAVALNWESMPEQMRAAVSALMVVLSLGLLVVGAILTFSGANAPLGVALMVVGAASLAAVAALNWNSMPQNVRSVVTTMMVLLGGALLVIGAILALSGAATPLGVGLMLAGAVTLAAAAALNWSSMSEEVRNTVSKIAAIVSVALLVIGVILCFTGVALPLGIALIAAGAAGLATVAHINWDFILEQLRSSWDRIRAWFNSTVAHVFTSQFWAEKGRSIANGLIDALNSALRGVGWFVNAVAGGISSILSWLGVSGASFSVSMPQIPHLAEGAVIPPNREFLAVLGDQRSGNNIEAPEELMRQIVREEAGSMLADAIAALTSGATDQRDVVLMVGHTELARETVRGLRALGDTGELGRLGLEIS